MALPVNPFASYWPFWNPVRRLVDFPTTFNLIWLFRGRPVGGTPGTTGAVEFNTGAEAYPASVSAFMNADIATCRARGQKILLSVGGANNQITINTQARADAFVASIKTINVQLGGSGTTAAIDGIDWNNFEGASVSGSGTWMTYAGQQLKAYYGSDFLITAPPAAFDLTSGGQGGSDRLLLATMYAGGALDWMCPQFYDGINSTAEVRSALDFYNTAVTVNGASVQIPRSLIGIGFGLRTTTWDNAGYWYIADAITTWNSMVSESKAPKGTFNWAFHLDPTNTFTQLASVVTNYTEALTPKFSLAASSNFTNGAATTVQLTPPTGKTISDFQAGSINESSNPAAALDLTTGKYTEIEWCFQATSDTVNNEQYEFRVTSNGTALNSYSVTPRWTIGTAAAPPDTTAPTVPTNLVATAVSTTQINLAWTASTDAVGVTGYKVYRGGVLQGETTSTSYNDGGLTANTSYTYTVSAFDAATNESAQSSSDTESTLANPVGDTTAPSVTITAPTAFLWISGTAYAVTATATDNVGVVGVQFYLHLPGGTVEPLGAEDTTGVGDVYGVTFDTTTKPNGVYQITAIARDAAGNTSSIASTYYFRIDNPPTEPETPAAATSTSTGIGSITGILSITL